MPGYFAADSMAVRVISKRAVGLTYGERALVVGAVNPRLYVGTAENTSHRESPWNRLALTARLFETVFIGTKVEADKALEFTRRKLVKVVGVLPEDAGEHAPAGTPYSANDPHLMFMTMAFTFDSAEAMHDLLVRRLSDDEREGLWQDFVRWAELFGMPRDAAPSSYPEFRDYFDDYLASDEPYLTDEAKLVGSYIAGAKPSMYPLPRYTGPAPHVLAMIVQGSLPPRIREIYGLKWTAADEAVFRSATLGLRAVHRRPRRLTQRPLRSALSGPSSSGYALVSRTERKNLRRGKESMPGVSTESRVVSLSGGPELLKGSRGRQA